MKLPSLSLVALQLLVLWETGDAAECGKWITNDCLGEDDIRYDPDLQPSIVEQNALFKMMEGFWISDLSVVYGPEGEVQTEAFFDPEVSASVLFTNAGLFHLSCFRLLRLV